MKTYIGTIEILPKKGVFVFGSNTQGIHGKGAALTARTRFGAILGQASGMMGRSYGIITKDLTKITHPSISKEAICTQIQLLYRTAENNPQLEFYIIYSGRGTNLNGYTNHEMAEMFSQHPIPKNIIFEYEFSKMLSHPRDEREYPVTPDQCYKP